VQVDPEKHQGWKKPDEFSPFRRITGQNPIVCREEKEGKHLRAQADEKSARGDESGKGSESGTASRFPAEKQYERYRSNEENRVGEDQEWKTAHAEGEVVDDFSKPVAEDEGFSLRRIRKEIGLGDRSGGYYYLTCFQMPPKIQQGQGKHETLPNEHKQRQTKPQVLYCQSDSGLLLFVTLD
jgi:hypothetical protein